jgi:hypothetical protein
MLNNRFTELKREMPTPVPVINVQSENPSLLSAILGKLSQPKEDKQNERELRGVAAALNNLARSQPTPAPSFNVTMPEITVNAQMPTQEKPSVTFAPSIKASDVIVRENTPVNVTVLPAAPAINSINVQPAAPAVNNITVQPAEPAINNVTVQPASVILPAAPKKATITTGKDGKRTLEVE